MDLGAYVQTEDLHKLAEKDTKAAVGMFNNMKQRAKKWWTDKAEK